MKLYSKILFAAIVCSAVIFTSCKKDDDKKVLPAMSGELSFDMPRFAAVGTTFTLTGKSIMNPVSGVKYFWYAKGLIKDSIAAQSVSITIPDSLATFTVRYSAQCKGYANTVVERKVTVVDPSNNGSLKEIPNGKFTLKDKRDGQWYFYTQIGDLYWFTENLKYSEAGVSYDNLDVMGKAFGRLYSWNEATGGVSATGLGNGPQGICPEGWSVPTNEDWINLAQTALDSKDELSFIDDWDGVGDLLAVAAKFNGNDVWPFSGVATPVNKVGWNGIPSGYSTNNGKYSSELLKYGFWWSSSEKDSESAYYRYIFYNQTGCPVNYTVKDGFYVSVRCVKKV